MTLARVSPGVVEELLCRVGFRFTEGGVPVSFLRKACFDVKKANDVAAMVVKWAVDFVCNFYSYACTEFRAFSKA